MSRERLSQAAAVVAFQSVSLTELQYAFDQVDFDLADVLRREQRVEAQISEAESDMVRARAQLLALGATIPDATSLPNFGAANKDDDGVPKPVRSVPVIPRTEDFEELATLAQARLDLMGVDLSRDPLSQVLPTSQVSDSIRDYGHKYGDVTWSTADWAVVSAAGAIATLLDIVLVRIPKDTTFLGKQQSGSPLTKWLQDEDRAGQIHKTYFKRFEKLAKVPYDAPHTAATGGMVSGMRPQTHRLQSPGHDPLLGLFFGIKDLMNGTGTYIDGAGVVVQHGPGAEPLSLIDAFVTQIRHLLSDVYTPQGIPLPAFSLLQLGQIGSPFALGKSGERLAWTDVSRYMYVNGYDLRHFFTMGIVPAVIELVIRGYWLLDGLATGKSTEDLKNETSKLASMLLLGHTIATSGTLIKTGLIYGMNPLALNYAQLLAMGKTSIAWVFEAQKREQRISAALGDEWDSILRDLDRESPASQG